MSHHLHQHIKHRVHSFCIRLFENPRGLHIDILIGIPHHRYHGLNVFINGLRSNSLPRPFSQRCRRGEQRLILLRQLTNLSRNGLPTILEYQRHYSLVEVAQFIRKIGIHFVYHLFVRKVPIASEGNLTHKEEAGGVNTVRVHELHGVNHVTQGLRNLLPILGPPSVSKDTFGQWQSRGHEEGGPVHGMETQNVLSYHMKRRRPIFVKVGSLLHFGVSQCAHVIRQGIDPHIHHMIIIVWHRHTPIECRSTNAQILQSPLDKRHDLIPS
mmetsp:Transcript_3373/g.6339  ORF Transcript_3373/g.6339 Transcript_3373/m.6339 type:complete len:269 (-) Transcript_3373:52-858(-)